VRRVGPGPKLPRRARAAFWATSAARNTREHQCMQTTFGAQEERGIAERSWLQIDPSKSSQADIRTRIPFEPSFATGKKRSLTNSTSLTSVSYSSM
jgi:hypothetical protein